MHSICLTFDFDAISLWLGAFHARSPTMISRGEFGVVGTPRILDLLDRFGIKSTWFVPGHTADTYPDTVEKIYSRGHEIAHHGYCHESPVNLEKDDERKVLEKGIAALEQITGSPPQGYRSPSWDLSTSTLSLLLEYGFVYDSSMMGSDYHPYWCRQGDQFDLESAFKFGKQVNLVEMPVSWGLDDFPAFEYLSLPNKLYPGLRSPQQVFEIWMGDYEYMRRYEPEGVFILTMHPQVIGRGHRMLFLERLFEHMLSEDVQFMRMIDFVEVWKQGKKPAISDNADR